jgi:spectrin beta
VEKMYDGLKDMEGERREKIDEEIKLLMLKREVDDLEKWIEEREVVDG